jgi:hypothetical protein
MTPVRLVASWPSQKQKVETDDEDGRAARRHGGGVLGSARWGHLGLFRGSWSGNWNGAVFNSSLGVNVVMMDSELPVLKDSKLHVSNKVPNLEDSTTRGNLSRYLPTTVL